MAAKGPAKKTGKRVATKSSVPGPELLKPPDNVLQIHWDPNKTEAQQYAEVGLRGVAPNAAIAGLYLGHNGFGGLGITESVQALSATVDRLQIGDFKDAESMLVSQAALLNAIFANLAGRAFKNMGEYPAATERYLRLAFKAQSQARCTLETLAEIKSPRQVTFAKQANIANGPQQVNNGVAREETESKPIELLEADNGEWMDRGAAGAAAAGHPEVEAVGAVHRAKD